MATDEDVRRTMILLFYDAAARGICELTDIYGRSAIRIGWVLIERAAKRL